MHAEAFAWFRRTNDLETLTETQRHEAWVAYAVKLIKEKAETLEIAPNSKKIKVEQCQAIKDRHAKLGERGLEQSWE